MKSNWAISIKKQVVLVIILGGTAISLVAQATSIEECSKLTNNYINCETNATNNMETNNIGYATDSSTKQQELDVSADKAMAKCAAIFNQLSTECPNVEI